MFASRYSYRQKGVQADSTGAGLSHRLRYEVVDIQREPNTLTVRGEDGQGVTFDPAKCVKKLVYQPVVLEVAVGDRLRWTRNDRQQHHRNGQELTVEAINGTQVTALDPSGQRYEIDAQIWQYLDYAWGHTIHSAQGKTADRVMVLAHDNIDQESFYVACSRVKHHLSVYTDSLEHLRQQAHCSRSQKNVTDYLSILRTQYAEQAATVPPQEAPSSESVESAFSRAQASPPAVPTSHPVPVAAPRESPHRAEQIRQQANEYRRQWVAYRDQLPATLTGEWLDIFIARQACTDAKTPDQVARIIVCGLNAEQYPPAERAAYAQGIAEDAVNHQTRQQQPRRRPSQKQPQRGYELE
ncbi:MAG: hypothetical protein AAF892_07790 [Cyanobacteria bacterium P01_D01_bin.71]